MSNTLSDKTNKSIAEIANKIMQEQPTKVRDFADTKPIESDMVQRVMNLNVPGHFVKEEVKQIDEANIYQKAWKIADHVNGSKPNSLDVQAPGHTVWKRGDGSSYRDPGKIHGHKDSVSAAWNHIKSLKGAKPVGHISGEHPSLERHETIKHDGIHYTNKGNHIAYGAASRTKNSNVWNLKKEEAEQVEEARFGRAIDPSKLSAAARARLEARAKKSGKEMPKAAPAPSSAAKAKQAERPAAKKPESSMAALAKSFGAKPKAEPKAAAPAKDETPAQKVRRQNMERQKDYYAKGGSHSGMNVGAGGRTSVTGHNTNTASGAVKAVKDQGRIKTAGLHSVGIDEGLKGNQTKIDVAPPYGKLTAQDFKALRAKHKKVN